MDHNFDFLCLSETWQPPNDFIPLNNSTPPGFIYSCRLRDSGRGGGLAMLYREKWKVLPVSTPAYHTFESITSQLSGPTPTIVATVYRPPKPNKEFLNDFVQFLTHLSTLSPNILLLGDFNIHMDNTSNALTRNFTSCIDSFGLHQLINFPTHLKGHTLDLICCSGLSPVDCKAISLPFSDHMLVSFNANLALSKINLPRTISFRNIKDINLDILSSGISSFPNADSFSTPDELVLHYNNSLHNLLDYLAPLKTRSVTFTRSSPWFTPALRQLKSKGHQLERLYNKTGLTVHKEIYHNHIPPKRTASHRLNPPITLV
ncbi:uncharacterized protein LOC126383485 isoform X1 [Epinephelus moara]|uniref:uncharacterized protein LOC126383485 isoform X1 n=1 Tax=Epinephelus moara TaxID=300413 RepID=UPI00214F3006|nr:uncharacterized protein LOC126383485 isoform X1 [Epinephelus moara]XP_049889965.1 uncharacterized protein LOC126383485 isoform X1 [Epinephelus moara]